MQTPMLTIALFCGLLLGCSQEPSSSPQGIIPEHQLETLEKAQSTEQLLLEAEQKRRQAMENQGL